DYQADCGRYVVIDAGQPGPWAALVRHRVTSWAAAPGGVTRGDHCPSSRVARHRPKDRHPSVALSAPQDLRSNRQARSELLVGADWRRSRRESSARNGTIDAWRSERRPPRPPVHALLWTAQFGVFDSCHPRDHAARVPLWTRVVPLRLVRGAP